MNLLLVTAALALGADEQPAAKHLAALDGKWLIVYAEEGGRRNNAWENRQAAASDGTLSYESTGGEKRSLKLKLGAHQTVEATLGGGGGADKEKASRGVYILGQDYLCISLSKGDEGAAKSSGDFILILRRQRGGARP
jgi:hypothetical protein